MRRSLTILSVAGVLVLVGGVAAASIPDSAGRVFVCAKAGQGLVVKDDGGTGMITCSNAQGAPVQLAQYRSGVLYGLHEVTVSQQVPLSYVIGDLVTVNATCPAGEVATGTGDGSPQDFAVQNFGITAGPTGSMQLVVVAVSTAHVGQVASATAQLLCAKVTA